MREISETGLVARMSAVVLLVIGLLWVGASYFEARAFEHVTGKEVSTFDAMFIELRVNEGAWEK